MKSIRRTYRPMDNNTNRQPRARRVFDIRPVNFQTADGVLKRVKKRPLDDRQAGFSVLNQPSRPHPPAQPNATANAQQQSELNSQPNIYDFSKPRLRRMGQLLSSEQVPVYWQASEDELKDAGIYSQLNQEPKNILEESVIGSSDFNGIDDYSKDLLLREISSNKIESEVDDFQAGKTVDDLIEDKNHFNSNFDVQSRNDVYFSDEKWADSLLESKEDSFYENEESIESISGIEREDNIFRRFGRLFKKKHLYYAMGFGLFLCMLTGGTYVWDALQLKTEVMGASVQGYSSLMRAAENIKDQEFFISQAEFDEAYENFSKVSEDLESFGGFLVENSKYIPFVSKLSSGKNMAEAGKHISLAGKSLSKVIDSINDLDNPFDYENTSNVSLLDVLQSITGYLEDVKKDLGETDKYLAEVKIDDLPEDKRDQFLMVKNKLPDFNEAVDSFINNNHIFVDLLGGYGPRKYLFLFENNHEMRPGGGFIGSYALLDIKNGRVRNFFVDGIFNPDGQLQSKIVPPKPIQKISANWSLHDSNWFASFPDSARKAIYFYEETGGPTADGVIALTPTIMEKLLTITGPVEMPEYDVTLTADNFIEKTQYEVEIDYDKEENRPKKILADLAPIILDRVFNSKDPVTMMKTMSVFSEGLKEKHIMFYSSNSDLQEIISEQGWSGEILDTQRDYINVVNGNINGFKTDGIIDQTISHQAEIQKDGSIIDTVTITRKHNGGGSGYEWWDSVNANYMQVFVPFGSQLLSAEGHTREVNDDPLDYDALGYERDVDVQKFADSTQIDEETGTRISEYANKTVFGNWVYVSPKETVAVEYKYLLPFKLKFDGETEEVASYSLLAQKQLGGLKTKFEANISYPNNFEVVWESIEGINKNGELNYEADFDMDQYIGAVFKK